jgi:transcriptional regulator with XRE-family HTH domain
MGAVSSSTGKKEVARMRTLREWRIERLMSVSALAEAAGVTRKTLIDLEHGRRRPHYETIAKLSRALDVEPRQIAEFDAALGDLEKDAA